MFLLAWYESCCPAEKKNRTGGDSLLWKKEERWESWWSHWRRDDKWYSCAKKPQEKQEHKGKPWTSIDEHVLTTSFWRWKRRMQVAGSVHVPFTGSNSQHRHPNDTHAFSTHTKRIQLFLKSVVICTQGKIFHICEKLTIKCKAMKQIFYNSANRNTGRMCLHRGRNGFSPYKNGPVQSHNSFLDQRSRKVIVWFHRAHFCTVWEPCLSVTECVQTWTESFVVKPTQLTRDVGQRTLKNNGDLPIL